MKELVIDRRELLSCIVGMNRNSLTLIIKGETYLVARRVFNAILRDASIPIFILEREYQGKKTKWLAIPTSF